MTRAARTIVGSAACVLIAAAAAAQDRPTVFMHGFGAEASDWAPTADRLKDAVTIQPHIPGLPWRSEFTEQAADLQSRPGYATLPTTTLAVGHSNGGIVARQWSRVRGVNGVVTIGTPHRGAPVMQHLFAWSSFNAVVPGLLNHVLGTFSLSSNWWWIYYFVEEALRWVSDFSIWSVVNLIGTVGAHAAMPVAWNMMPGSVYLTELNSSANLAREAADIPNRVGIASVAHNFYYAGPARAVAPGYADAIAGAMYGAAFGLIFWGNWVLVNSPFDDFAAISQAMSLLDVAGYILAIDPTYCRLVSSADMSECIPNDGLVPITSQTFPGAPNLMIEGPAHTQEKQQSDDALFMALTMFMHVPPRNAPAPSPAPPPAPAPDPTPDPDPDPVPPPDGDPITISTGLLLPDQMLRPDDEVTSTDGRLRLRYQSDGNLVLYHDGWTPLWHTHTDGTSAGFAAMQTDGNFVVYDAAGVPRWASGSSLGHPGAYLVVQTDGNVVIYDPDGTPLWSTGTSVP